MEEGNSILVEKDKSILPTSMPYMHEHPCHEIYVLIAGRRRYFVGHRIYDLVPGNVIIIPKGELHRTTAIGTAGYDRYVLYFLESRIQSLIKSVGRETFDAFLKCRALKISGEIMRKIQEKMEFLRSENNKGDALTKAFEENALCEILLTLMRHGEEKQSVSGGTAEKIQEAAQYINENYTQDITLHDAAQLANMEDTYFSKQFKALTGFGFHECLVKTRIKAAEDLLRNTTLPVGKIALRCGFSTGNYLGDVFKAHRGMSPSQYRKVMLRRKNES